MSGEPELSAELVRLWRLPVVRHTGRPAELDVQTVVQSAVALADRDGLSGVTLPKVAESLACTTMALYRYVGSKDSLLILMADLAYGDPPDIVAASGQWREGLHQWTGALYKLRMQRPWLNDISLNHLPSGPHDIAWLDAGLRQLRSIDVGWAEKVGIVTLLANYAAQTARLAIEQREALHDDADGAYRNYGQAMATLVDPARFPDASHLFDSDTFHKPRQSADPVSDFDFTFGLEIILEGAAAVLDS